MVRPEDWTGPLLHGSRMFGLRRLSIKDRKQLIAGLSDQVGLGQ